MRAELGDQLAEAVLHARALREVEARGRDAPALGVDLLVATGARDHPGLARAGAHVGDQRRTRRLVEQAPADEEAEPGEGVRRHRVWPSRVAHLIDAPARASACRPDP